jgi:hypothetical protein
VKHSQDISKADEVTNAMLALDRVRKMLGEDVAEQTACSFLARLAEIQAFRQVVAWAISNQELFEGRNEVVPDTSLQPPIGGWAGYWSDDCDWRSIRILQHIIVRVLRDFGYDPYDILRGWRERGWIEADQGRFTIGHSIGDGELKISVVSILRKGIVESGG